jgi:hypothetical protein
LTAKNTVTLLLVCAAVAAAIVLLAWARETALRRRPRLLAEILDLADALERDLLECRARLRELPALTAHLPPSESLSARATLAAEPQVQDALRDLLAHRLWLQDNARRATLAELGHARDALAATRASLELQLARLADVRADFEHARVTHGAPPPAR